MFEKTDQPLHYDLLIAGDFSRLEDCKKAEEKIKHGGKQQRVCLFHWPDFIKKPKALCNLYFELLEQGRIEPVVMGQLLECAEYLITDKMLENYPLDGYPEMVEFYNWRVL